MYLYGTHLFALFPQVIHYLLNAAAHGAHSHDDTLCIRVAVIVEGVIVPPCDGIYLLHLLVHDVGQSHVVCVVCLTHLEVYIRVLHRGTHLGMLRIQGMGTECIYGIIVRHFCKVVIGNCLHLGYLMGCAEAVKEVHEGDSPLYGCKVSHSRKIHYLLHTGGGDHAPPCLAAGVYIRMIPEYGQGMGAYGACSNVEHCRMALPCYAVHSGYHEHKPL